MPLRDSVSGPEAGRMTLQKDRGVMSVSPKNLSRDNHYLPICYQEAFANYEGKVWIKYVTKPDPELRKPSRVGRKRSLYIIKENGVETDRVEDFFDKTVENDFAVLSRRIKEEQNRFTQMSRDEVGILTKFVASQAVRTPGHKEAIEEQAGSKVDTNTFVRVMSRKMFMLLDSWISNPPTFRFYTTLPKIGDHFITGDHPVAVLVPHDSKVITTTENPELKITNLVEILQNPKYAFMVSLSPYIAVSVQRAGSSGQVYLPPQEIDLSDARRFNDLIRGQCRVFTLARERDSLF
jgi:hypothetical protein